jgi:uncharacterized protein YdeI (YjbR/CyaY-like superfamily)
MKTIYCEDILQWRQWLVDNRESADEVWLVFLKGRGGKQSLNYGDALDEALCFGWIDSLIKKIDETQYTRKFSKRRETSKWSKINKERIEKLIHQNRMTPSGCAVVEKAKANGSWDKPDRQPVEAEAPPALKTALEKNRKAGAYFDELAPSHKLRYIMWIATAKKSETIEKRVQEAIQMLEKKKLLGLK